MRVYFEHGSSTLTPEAMQALDAAARNMAGCAHTEMHVTIGAGRLATARGQAIMTAMHDHGFDVARIETSMRQLASISSAPDYVEVLMTPDMLPVNNAAPMPRAGV